MCHTAGRIPLARLVQWNDYAFDGSSPAEAPIAPAAPLIELRIEAIPLRRPDAGLAPAAATLQGIQLLPYGCRTLAVVTAFGAGGWCIPKVLSNGCMAAPRRGSECRGAEGLVFALPVSKPWLSHSLASTALHSLKPFRFISCVSGTMVPEVRRVWDHLELVMDGVSHHGVLRTEPRVLCEYSICSQPLTISPVSVLYPFIHRAWETSSGAAHCRAGAREVKQFPYVPVTHWVAGIQDVNLSLFGYL